MTPYRRRIALTLDPSTRRVLEALAAARDGSSISSEVDRLVMDRYPVFGWSASAARIPRSRISEIEAALIAHAAPWWIATLADHKGDPVAALRDALLEAPNVADEIVDGTRPRVEWDYAWRRLEREVVERWAEGRWLAERGVP